MPLCLRQKKMSWELVVSKERDISSDKGGRRERIYTGKPKCVTINFQIPTRDPEQPPEPIVTF